MTATAEASPLYITIILGTARQGRQSEHVANFFLLSEMKKRPEIETEVIDVRQLKMRLDDAGEEMKDPGVRKEDDARGRASDRLRI
jgi:hypothetical protein